MPKALSVAPIFWSSAPLPSIDADLIVIPWFEDERPAIYESVNRASAGEVERALASGEFRARPYELFLTTIADREWKGRRLGLVGAGSIERFDTSIARRVATVAALAARQRRVRR